MANTATACDVRCAGVYGRTDARKNKEKNLTIDNSYHCIDEYAFKNNIKIRRLILDKNISEICRSAFLNCTAMKSIEMPGVRVIGKAAFEGCVRLGEAELADSLEQLGEAAFKGCKRLEKVQIGEKSECRIIPVDSFYECQRLKCVNLPVNTSTIHARAFYKCPGLSELHFYKGIREIGESAFYNCGFTDLKLPLGVEKIGDSAFLKCRKLEYVKLPASIRKIEKWAFHGCDRLKLLEFTEDPEYIGEWLVNRSTVIRCKKGSMVDEYCSEFGFKTEYISEI